MRRGLSAVRRLPLRLRLTLVFLGVMAILLSALGVFLSLQFRLGLNQSINDALDARAHEIAGLLANPASPRGSLRANGESFAQILNGQGLVLNAGVGLLTRAQAARAMRGPVFVEREGVRLLAVPTRSQRSIVVVGASLAENERTIEMLNGALVFGGLVTLLLASLAAHALTTAALRPVESMRARASTISVRDTHARLPLPESRDEIYRLGKTLNEMLARIERGIVHEREFLADASHELRNPLAVLKGELEVALAEDGSRGQMRDSLRSAAEETDRVVALAEDLLILARTEHDALPLSATCIGLHELLETVTERFDDRARRAGRRLIIDVPPGQKLYGDPRKLERAVCNLLDNALRYGRGTITVTATAHDGQVEFHVLDAGPGFPPEFLSRAFKRFSRADHARSRGGAGLGLAIVDAIARAHGGRASASNRPGGGAEVYFSVAADFPELDEDLSSWSHQFRSS
jgi:signal transduction histidine kinase